MTSGPNSAHPARADQPTPTQDTGSRITMKPPARSTGSVDGAWWPRSLDLSAELPELISALTERLGRIERVSYHLGSWGANVRRRIEVDGHRVRLSGYLSQRTGTLDLTGTHRRATVMVVPPETAEGAADDMLATASRPGNSDSVAHLLSLRGPAAPEPR